jgi:hypothetical protein
VRRLPGGFPWGIFLGFASKSFVMLLAPRVAALRLGNGGSDVAISASHAFEGIVVTPLLLRRARFIRQPNDARGRRSPDADRSLARRSMRGTLRHRSGT